MKQLLIKQGAVLLEDVPAPVAEPGTVLVRVANSCISIGTEMSGVRASGVPLWKRALKQPAKAKAAISKLIEQGVGSAAAKIGDRVAAVSPTGYSASGIVVEVGAGVADLRPGDRVACAGAQCAFHAEYIAVPRNLVAVVDQRVELPEASTVTLGAIALQGVRRANPTLGETFVVIGLGILGQLTVQMLRANGCHVIGADLDPARVRLARDLGAMGVINPDATSDVDEVNRLTDGIGADGVIITAATPSDAVMSTAFRMCRKKGRVVLVGDVGLALSRADFYEKELDFFISTSYGPGRYDTNYEEHGLDYPIGYVRWTENRNMTEYLRMIADGRVKVTPLVSATYPIGQAPDAYAALSAPGAKPLMVLLQYPQANTAPLRTMSSPIAGARRDGAVGLALIGAGAFAKAVHLPNIRSMPERIQLRSVVNRTGHSAMAVAQRFGAMKAGTDFEAVLDDPDIDAVLIATRHDRHADMTLAALARGKHVLVEKPLALTRDELERIAAFFNGREPAQAPVLLTGFNRRFSPYARRLRDIVTPRGPSIINYRMNAGYIPLDHWVHGAEGGGRNRGEACHIYDLFTFLTNSEVMTISAHALRPQSGRYSSTDNFVASMTFADGSIANLTYSAVGSPAYPKERLELHADGVTVVMNDFRSLEVFGAKAEGLTTRAQEKGQREELEAFADAVSGRSGWPIPLWQQIQATEIANRVDELLVGSRSFEP